MTRIIGETNAIIISEGCSHPTPNCSGDAPMKPEDKRRSMDLMAGVFLFLIMGLICGYAVVLAGHFLREIELRAAPR